MPFPKISRAKAAQVTAAEHQMEMVNMPSVAPLFLETPIFSTTITIVNAATPPADGLLVLRADDGTVILRKSVPIAGHFSTAVKVGDLLASVGSKAQQGRVELYDDRIDGASLVGQLTIQYSDRNRTHTLDEEVAMPNMTTSHALRAVAVSSTGAPFIAVTNPATQPERVIASCYPENAVAQRIDLKIPPQETIFLKGCLLLTGASDPQWMTQQASDNSPGTAYAIELKSTTPNGELQAFGLAPHANAGSYDWTSVNFFDPDKFASPKTIFAGIPIGVSPLLWGTYTPHLALHNFANTPQTVNVHLDATLDGFVSQTTLQKVTLQPGQSESLDINQAAGSKELLNTLVIEGSDPGGGIAAQLMLEDITQDMRMQLIGKSDSDDTNAGLHPWDLSGHDDNDLLLYNETETTQKAFLKIGNGTSIWTKTVNLLPGMTERFSLRDMMSKGALDDLGAKLTKGSGQGEFSWTADKAGLLKGRLVRLNSSTRGIESFQCDGYIVICGADISGSSALTVGQTGNWNANANTCVSIDVPTACTGEPGGGYMTYNFMWSSSSGISGLDEYDTSGSSSSASASGTATSTGAQSVSVNVSAGSCTSSASENVTVTAPQTPTTIPVVQTINNGPPSCPAGQSGALRRVIRQVKDQTANPIMVSGQQIHEVVTPVAGKNGLNIQVTTSDATTDSQGEIIDTFSFCSSLCPSSGATSTFTQAVTDTWNNTAYSVGSYTLTYSCAHVAVNGSLTP